MNICYILSYKDPEYVRTKTLLNALQQIQDIKVFRAVNTIKGIFRYIQTIILLTWIRITKNPEHYILGFRGYEIFWIVRIIVAGKILIFDHMMSPYDSLLNETKSIKKNSIFDKLIFFYEKKVLQYSDIILTDTVLHKNFFVNLFKLEPEKIIAIPVSADEVIFRQKDNFNRKRDKNFFNVLFYGSFLPLHGIKIILKAAYLLRDLSIKFTIIGGENRSLIDFYRIKKNLKLNNVNHIKWVPLDQLPGKIEMTDIFLGGPFGNTGQAKRVITGKTFQSLAMAKTVIIGRIDYDYGFIDKENCLLVKQASENELAYSIKWCLDNKDKLFIIGKNGRELYLKNFSTLCIKGLFRRLIIR